MNLDTGSTFVTRMQILDVSHILRCRIRDDNVMNRFPLPSDMPPTTPTLYLPQSLMKALEVSLGSKELYLILSVLALLGCQPLCQCNSKEEQVDLLTLGNCLIGMLYHYDMENT